MMELRQFLCAMTTIAILAGSGYCLAIEYTWAGLFLCLCGTSMMGGYMVVIRDLQEALAEAKGL